MRRAATGTFVVLLTAGGTLGIACSGDDDDSGSDLYTPTLSGGTTSASNTSTGNKSSDDDDDSATGGKKGTGGGGNTTKATGGTSTVSWKGCDGVVIPPEEAEKNTCQEEYYETEPMPVDLVIMMDRSVSLAEEVPELGMTRWEGMVQAMETFVNNPDVLNKDVRASLQFFNQSGGHVEQTDCDVARYLTPRVPMGSLADNGQDIVDAMAETKPAGQTPTAPALQGALMYARQWNAQGGGGRATAVLLVSDGLPTRCQDPISVEEVADLAEAYANPPLPDDGGDLPPAIPTFVVGLGPATNNLNSIAMGGGTDEAYAIDLDADAADAFAEVLSKITNAQLSCDFIVPEKLRDPAMRMNYDKNRIWYTPPGSTEIQQIPRVANANACKGGTYGGWYYQYPDDAEDDATPNLITVCPCTCALFRTGLINIQWGCSPIPL
ncbi:MAG: VWA domain-containing protein [Polyangiaceae bacterium]|nr:VWA domain-containing protein [Polyangiaceae bacterium]